MTIRLLGNRRDVIAFGLAGLDVAECRTRAELIEALDVAQSEPHLALLIVAPSVAALAPDLIGRLRESTTPPIAVVLPAAAVDTGAGSRAA